MKTEVMANQPDDVVDKLQKEEVVIDEEASSNCFIREDKRENLEKY